MADNNELLKLDFDENEAKDFFESNIATPFKLINLQKAINSSESTKWFRSKIEKIKRRADELTPDGSYGNWKRNNKRTHNKLIKQTTIFENPKISNNAYRTFFYGIDWTKTSRKDRQIYAAVLVGYRRVNLFNRDLNIKAKSRTPYFRYSKPGAKRQALYKAKKETYDQSKEQANFLNEVYKKILKKQFNEKGIETNDT
ncbi:hypothetical protein [Mesomycoplasma molare]|uniref:Uncharacterized protein n=1 Tax=Mesomycoplasma molare TaxID=171288 RepID=A0ABY5TTQ7_9BACT|nr:hypothetical protein [Mesomycoplasma molare]UWD34057.1 hypothetical protein NX772_03045 [Mesomycoplasma molare]